MPIACLRLQVVMREWLNPLSPTPTPLTAHCSPNSRFWGEGGHILQLSMIFRTSVVVCVWGWSTPLHILNSWFHATAVKQTIYRMFSR